MLDRCRIEITALQPICRPITEFSMKSLLHLCLVLMTSTLIANPSTKVDFIDGSLNLAIQKAGQEGKLLFVEFGAQWCMPCRFMDENTFKDQEVISYIAENYVPHMFVLNKKITEAEGLLLKCSYTICCV